jgi:hypothetical protein
LVTAIVIPIIIIYFFIISKQDLQTHTEKWLALEDVYEEAMVAGKIHQMSERQERFYYHRYVHILELTLMNNHKTIAVSKITPLTKGKVITNDLQLGDEIRVFGNWKEGHFRFKRYELLQNKKEH